MPWNLETLKPFPRKEQTKTMKNRLLITIFSLTILILTTGMNGGCGETVHESSSYYYPNWMPDGRIIAYKVTSRWSQAIWGRKELGDTDYITAITINSSNEITEEEDLFETSGYLELVCSPTGEMIAVYFPGYPIGIWLYDYEGNKTKILDGVNVQSADWSPDGTKIVYSTGNLYVVNVDGLDNILISSEVSVPVSWRVGTVISYGYLYAINSDGTDNNYLADGGKPQNMNSGGVLYFADLVSPGIYKIKSVYLSGTGEVTVLDTYERSTLKLSFDNAKIVGGDLITGGGSWIGGIWVVNIDGTQGKRLK